MGQVSTIGLDLAKSVFQVHGADASGAVVFRNRLRRSRVRPFLAAQPPCTVAMEAWAAEDSELALERFRAAFTPVALSVRGGLS